MTDETADVRLRVRESPLLQAAAACGQILLAHAYQEALARQGIGVAHEANRDLAALPPEPLE